MAASYAQDGEFIDYYENLDGDDLPEDYKELYDSYGSERDRLYGGSEERIEAEEANLRRFASAAIPKMEAYNKLVREEHAARYVTTRGTTTPPVTRSRTVDPKDIKGCRDSDSRCESWGLNGWCALWKPITQVYCRKTCGFCDGMAAPCTDDADVAPYCKNWKKNGDCESDRDYMFQRCPNT